MIARMPGCFLSLFGLNWRTTLLLLVLVLLLPWSWGWNCLQ